MFPLILQRERGSERQWREREWKRESVWESPRIEPTTWVCAQTRRESTVFGGQNDAPINWATGQGNIITLLALLPRPVPVVANNFFATDRIRPRLFTWSYCRAESIKLLRAHITSEWEGPMLYGSYFQSWKIMVFFYSSSVESESLSIARHLWWLATQHPKFEVSCILISNSGLQQYRLPLNLKGSSISTQMDF